MATFYITKYALSAKIEVIDATPEYPEWLNGRGWIHAKGMTFYVDRDVFADPTAAIADAEKRRGKKVASLAKQIAKLEKLQFSTPELPV